MDERRVLEGAQTVQRSQVDHAVAQRNADPARAAAVLLALIRDQTRAGLKSRLG